METVIEIEELTKVYPRDVTALSNLTLDIPKGVYGLLGPNGSGKTTLIQILAGVVKPTHGSVKILGYDLNKESNLFKRKIGYLPEHLGMYEDMRGLDFLNYMGRLSGLGPKNARLSSRKSLSEVGLSEWGNVRIRSYSGGMKQRLAFAQSVLNNPCIIFLDEPTKSLDPIERHRVLSAIIAMGKQGRTVFLSSHLLVEIEQVADYIAILNNGNLVYQASIEDIREQGLLSDVYRKILIAE